MRPPLRRRPRVTAEKRRWYECSVANSVKKLELREIGGLPKIFYSGIRKYKVQLPNANSVRKLERREIGRLPRWAQPCRKRIPNFTPEKFQNIQLQEEYNTYDNDAYAYVDEIVHIVAEKDVIVALTKRGVCAAFSRTTNNRICYLNRADEMIISLFYNEIDDSLITVCASKCRVTPIEHIRSNQLHRGHPLFETEFLENPGFVEFDDINGKVLIISRRDDIIMYKVFELKDYSFLFSVSTEDVLDFKISSGIMMLIFNRAPVVPMRILSIEDGSLLISLDISLQPNKYIELIELFHEKLLVKQMNENLRIYDVWNSEFIEVSKNDFQTPSDFIFLHESRLFLKLEINQVAVWNSRGQLVTTLEDHFLWYPAAFTSATDITNDRFMISCCREGDADHIGSININKIMSGRCVAKINSKIPAVKLSPRGSMGKRSTIRSTIGKALDFVTAVYYNDDRNEIYTGNDQCLIHVWSN